MGYVLRTFKARVVVVIGLYCLQDTALHLAAANNATKVIEFLLSAGATLLLNNSKQSAIDVAIQNRHQEAATSMVQHDR